LYFNVSVHYNKSRSIKNLASNITKKLKKIVK
jgi:hypothetical protein